MNTIQKDGKREPVGASKGDASIIPIWMIQVFIVDPAEKTYSTKSNYQIHIKKFHSDVLQQPI